MEQLGDRRGRQYDLQPLSGIQNPKVGYVAAILDEARERCVDLITDMTEQAMWTRPAGSPFSAGELVVHMNWAEFVWLSKIGRHQLPEETVVLIERGNLKQLYAEDSWSIPVPELVALCRKTKEQLLIPCLSGVSDLDEAVAAAAGATKGPKTVRHMLMHVITSWIYHSGQVGLMTMQNGLDYQWAFA